MCTLDLDLYFWTFTPLMLVTFSSVRAQIIQTSLAIKHKLAPLSLALSFNLWQVRITHTSWLMGLSTNLFFHLACTAEQSTQRESSSLWSAHSPRHVVHLWNGFFFFTMFSSNIKYSCELTIQNLLTASVSNEND